MQREWLDELLDEEEEEYHDEEEREYERWNAIMAPTIGHLERLLSEPPPQLAERLAPIIQRHEYTFIPITPMDNLSRIWDAISELDAFLDDIRKEDPVVDWCVELALLLKEAQQTFP